MLEDMAKTASIQDERERLLESQIDSLEGNLKFISDSSEKKIKVLLEEKKQNENTYNEQTKFFGEREKSMEDNNERLKGMNLKLIEIFEEREQLLNSEIDFMRDEIKKLQLSFDTREISFIKESERFAINLEKYHNIVTKAQKRLERGWDPSKPISDVLRQQIADLHNSLDHKSR
jgi:hypothetical protein